MFYFEIWPTKSIRFNSIIGRKHKVFSFNKFMFSESVSKITFNGT